MASVNSRKPQAGNRQPCRIVFWTGEGKFGPRVGFKDASGTEHWTDVKNVDPVGTSAAPTPGVSYPPSDRIAALEARVEALEAALADRKT